MCLHCCPLTRPPIWVFSHAFVHRLLSHATFSLSPVCHLGVSGLFLGASRFSASEGLSFSCLIEEGFGWEGIDVRGKHTMEAGTFYGVYIHGRKETNPSRTGTLVIVDAEYIVMINTFSSTYHSAMPCPCKSLGHELAKSPLIPFLLP